MTYPPQRPLSLLLAASLLLCATAPLQARTPKCESPPVLRFSLIPLGDVDKQLASYRPLLKRLETLTGRPVTVVRPNSYASVVEGLLNGGIDIASLGPASYVETKRGDPQVTAFATIEKRAGRFQVKGPYYHALLVTLADTRFTDIAALKGAHLALTDPVSTSGSLLPREQFTPKLGVPLEQYFGIVSFTGGHGKSVQALAKGDVDAAFIASAQLEEAHVSGKLPADRLRVLWQSGPIPYDPYVHRGQLCAPLRQQISAAFFAPEAARELRGLLDDLKAERFMHIDDSHYATLRKLLE